ncbi:hypothetical protein QQ73_05790 [Candidatus Endoriftia persephone str. Guaymas]|nr:hypothetical protein [Candidatus Endoriftia persephone str. Guaymas]
MGVRVKTGHTLLAAALGLGMTFGAQAGKYPDISPLPDLKINKAKAELGKRLFFDRRLSGDAGIACADCHQPKHGYAHPDALSPGYPGNGHFRNIPSTRPLRANEKGGADKGTKDSEDRLTATVGSASAEPAQLQSNLQTIYLRSP